jgi:ribosome-associated toxin RatA of RatAB toxin-antitoxin module
MPSHSRVIPAKMEAVFAVLSDYQSYPDWTPDVVAATVLAREGDIVVAEFLSPFLIEKKYVLEFLHSRPTSIVYKQVDQFGARGVRGAWQLEEAAGGGTTVTGTMNFKTEAWAGLANRRRAGLILRRRFDALDQLFPATADGRAAAAAPEPSMPADAIVDVLERGEPATVNWLGTRYLLTKTDR